MEEKKEVKKTTKKTTTTDSKKNLNSTTKKSKTSGNKKNINSTKKTKIEDNKKKVKKSNAVKKVSDVTEKKQVSKKSKQQEIEMLEKTNSFDIIIDDERLKDKDSLDFSFIDGKRKKKKAHKDIEILEDINYKEEAKNIEIPKKKRNGNDAIMTTIIIIFSLALGFLICFIWARQSDYFAKVVKEEVVKTKVVVDDNYVFLGDSIFEGYDLKKFYDGLPVINSGIAGHKTTDLLKDMNNRVYKYNPSKVFILIGTNDFVDISKEDTIKNIGKIIDGIKENRPYAEIYVQSIYPVNASINQGGSVCERNNEDINFMNDGIKKICTEKEVAYMDIHKLLVDDEGNLKKDYTKDGLHVNDTAYEIITEEIMKVLKK